MEPFNTSGVSPTPQTQQNFEKPDEFKELQRKMADITRLGEECTKLISSANNLPSLEERTITNLPSGSKETGIPGQPDSWKRT